MTVSLSEVRAGITALKRDLIHADGPQISTMRNYRFAIVPYNPHDEFKLRQLVQDLAQDLRDAGWVVKPISLQTLLLNRVREQLGEDVLHRMMEMERRTAKSAPERGLQYLQSKLAQHIEGPEGIAADVARDIRAFTEQNPDKADRTLVLIGRAGALYPFFRTSSLLKHLDGQTGNVPVVLLYPGSREDQNGLSFMGKVNADRDYRPRIYP